jgi:V-type H+-transporting ATPase subunit a
MERVQSEIDACDFRNGNTVKTALVEIPIPKAVQPPTWFKTNSYTEVYQNIVQAYGAPSYKEINPAYFYVY